jgi:ferredoxin-NADP reductase
MVHIHLEVPDTTRQSHLRPGQYVGVRTPAGESPFALTSLPGDPFALLIKRAAPVANFLADMRPFAPLFVSAAAGAGFAVDDVTATTPAVLCATGSGIAPLWPLLRLLVARGNRPWLLYGSTLQGAFAFQDELKTAAALGQARVDFYTSRENDPEQADQGRLTLGLARGEWDWPRAVVFLCGVPAMIDQATERCLALGVRPQNVRLNY